MDREKHFSIVIEEVIPHLESFVFNPFYTLFFVSRSQPIIFLRPTGLISKFNKTVTVLLLFSLIVSAASCSTTRQVPTEDPSKWTSHSRIWIVLNDGRTYLVKDPRLVDSRLEGNFQPNDRGAIDLAQIESLSIKRLDRVKTIGLVAWALVATAVVISILSDGENESEPCPT